MRRHKRRRKSVSRRRSAYNRGHRKLLRRSRRNKGRGRRVSAYARFVGAKMRAGKTMKQAAQMWKKH